MKASNWTSLGETEGINKPEYHFAIEEFRCGEDQMVFLHLTVRKWSVSVAKEILRNWKLFRQCVTCPVFANGDGGDQVKWEAFVSLLGFQFLTNIICENGVERRLFVHCIKEKENERTVAAKPTDEPATEL